MESHDFNYNRLNVPVLSQACGMVRHDRCSHIQPTHSQLCPLRPRPQHRYAPHSENQADLRPGPVKPLPGLLSAPVCAGTGTADRDRASYLSDDPSRHAVPAMSLI
jgi:hypothetical protein